VPLLRRRRRVEFEVSSATFETIGLACLAGLRSMAAPAFLAQAVRRGDLRAPVMPALGSPKVSALLALLAMGEMIADKTPFVPARTSTPALLGRVLSGGLAGATLFASEGRDRNSGALLGALCATLAAYAGENFRTVGFERLGLPNALLGALEDKVVLALGRRILRRA
jgi:uncharacterized membrane protein